MYQNLILPINIGTNTFSPKFAYFLGAILSTNESYCEGNKRYWLAPIRHNKQKLNKDKVNLHEDLIKENLKCLNGRIFEAENLIKKDWFPSNKIGFAIVFESPVAVVLNDLITPLSDIFDKITLDVLRSFIIGAYDGRGYLDINSKNKQIRYLSLDVDNEKVASLLLDSLKKFNLKINYNQSRERLEGGLPRKAQVRIHGSDMPNYMEDIGFISPTKFEQIQSLLDSKLTIYNNDDILFGLKSLSLHQKIQKPIIAIPNEIQEIETFEDTELINVINNSLIQSDASITYSATPKEKMSTVLVKGKLVYKRDKKTAINALTIAKYRCEIDITHPSFIRKKSDILYTEPHHLIPLAYQDMFDVSLDVEENIVSLCSNCHNPLHYGKGIDFLLTNLYEQRKLLLKTVGINISLEELLKMYNI